MLLGRQRRVDADLQELTTSPERNGELNDYGHGRSLIAARGLLF